MDIESVNAGPFTSRTRSCMTSPRPKSPIEAKVLPLCHSPRAQPTPAPRPAQGPYQYKKLPTAEPSLALSTLSASRSPSRRRASPQVFAAALSRARPLCLLLRL
jgi:hypothetical protein